jgi:GT2 family glycosyltransferase
MTSSPESPPLALHRVERAPVSDRPVVSFIIPVRNDAARLRGCLKTIRANTYPATCVEILVADNGSTDGSVETARACGAKVIELPELPVAALRNRAAANATGDVLAFVDADHEIDAAWVASAVERFDDPAVAAVGALCMAPPGGTWVQHMYDGLRGRTVGRGDVEWLGSGNMAVRRSAFDRVGGFDMRLETCEDVDLCQRLRAAGHRLAADDRLKNVHLGDPATLRALFRGELWRGRDNLRVSLRQGLAWRGLPSVLIPIVDALCLIGAAAALLATPFVGLWLLSVAAAIVAPPLLLALLRAARIAGNRALRAPADVFRAYLVAATYDAARALALLMRARHHRPGRAQAWPVSRPLA